ncbi:glycosyltransferase family 39 protein [Desulfovibrio sp. TomC]|uniref:glycosyltransferase family 39 protein n=1 Tax=Desulfovibrio sp. TomC TaxID=1562888 RepID=UPI000575DCF4|nr:glycosyltransferase family 39 protein [Desulfovibrio sp. TomC]KHK00734.1 putative inner membrane protein [Desulfovibrio sp. TomC]
MPTTDHRRLHLCLLLLLLAAAVCLRLPHLGDPSLWWDEFITLGTALLPVDRMVHTLTVIGPSDFGGEFFPPLYHLITRAVLVVSHDDAVLRCISVIAGTASIAVVYGFVGELFTRRAGLFAAALTTFCVYHIHYSRELRPYSLFTLLGLASLWTLYRALTRGGLGNHAAYVLCTAAMCYSSSMGTTNIGAEGLFTAFFLIRGVATRELSLGRAMRKGLALAACVWLVGLCYLPWLPAYRNIFALLRLEKSPGIPADFVLTVLSEFFSYAAPKRGLPWLPLALTCLVGLGVALRRQYRTGLVLLALFALMPVVAFLAAGTKLEISSRYVFNAFFALAALGGLGIDAICSRTLRYLDLTPGRIALVAPLAGLGCCLLLSAADFASLPTYYRRETSYNKELADYLVWNKNNVEYLFLQSNRNPKLITNWYLPGVYRNLAHYVPKGYKRAYHIIQSDLTPAALPFPPHKAAKFMDSAVYRLGLVSAAPVTLFPDAAGTARYTDAFDTYRFYADCDEAVNIAPESRYHTLTHYDYDKPGHVLYRFVAAPGTAFAAGRLSLDFSATFNEGIASDSRVVVSVAVGQGAFAPLDVVTGEAFLGADGVLIPANHEKRRFIKRSLALPDSVAGATVLRLRIDYGPVANPGVVEVCGLELSAGLTGSPQGDNPALAMLKRVAANNALAAWKPGQNLIGDALFAFPTSPELPQGPANPAAALPGFLAAHPGLAPVFTIQDANGQPAYQCYDPALNQPFVPLAEDRPATLTQDNAGNIFAALKLHGAFNRPRLSLGGKTVGIGVLAPAPSTLLLDRDGVGVLRFEPSFAHEADALAAFPIALNIKKNDDEDCLSCKDAAPCSLTVPISSTYPIKLLRILAYPRVFADKAGQNTVRISFSSDGKTFTPLDTLKSNRSGFWEGLMVRRVSVLRFDRPIHNGFVRFDFSGPGAQLWSRDDTRMRIEAVLDASAFTGLTVPSATFQAELRDNAGAPLEMLLSPDLLPYRPTLQDNF